MKFKKAIATFTFGFFIGSLGTYALTEKNLDAMRTDMKKLNGEISRIKEIIEPFEQVKKFTVKVTGYSNDSGSINVPEWQDGLTATGTIASKGTIAADWDIFKQRTNLYVPDYGIGTVVDRGSKVKGHHIDIFFDSREEALKWGVRKMEILMAER
ncbi:MAG: 3D domain-containing protein [Nitrospirota bacterium]